MANGTEDGFTGKINRRRLMLGAFGAATVGTSTDTAGAGLFDKVLKDKIPNPADIMERLKRGEQPASAPATAASAPKPAEQPQPKKVQPAAAASAQPAAGQPTEVYTPPQFGSTVNLTEKPNFKNAQAQDALNTAIVNIDKRHEENAKEHGTSATPSMTLKYDFNKIFTNANGKNLYQGLSDGDKAELLGRTMHYMRLKGNKHLIIVEGLMKAFPEARDIRVSFYSSGNVNAADDVTNVKGIALQNDKSIRFYLESSLIAPKDANNKPIMVFDKPENPLNSNDIAFGGGITMRLGEEIRSDGYIDPSDQYYTKHGLCYPKAAALGAGNDSHIKPGLELACTEQRKAEAGRGR